MRKKIHSAGEFNLQNYEERKSCALFNKKITSELFHYRLTERINCEDG